MTGATAVIVAQQRLAAVKLACRAMGLRGQAQAYPVTGKVVFTFDRDTSWTYDQLAAVVEAVGTRDVNFTFDGGGPGTEFTPGDPPELAAVFSWPRES